MELVIYREGFTVSTEKLSLFQVEGYWPAQAVFDMLKKIDSASFNQSGASYSENVTRQAAAKV